MIRYLMRRFVGGERIWPTCDCIRQGKMSKKIREINRSDGMYTILPKGAFIFCVSNNSGFNQTNAVVLYEPLFMNIFYTWQRTSHAGVTEQPSLSWWCSTRSL